MRFLFVVGAFPPADKHGGTSVTNYALAKAIKSRGHSVFVLTTDRNGTERLDVPHGDTEWEGVPVRYCRWLKSPLPFHSPEIGKVLEKRCSFFDIALISSAWTMYGVDAGIICRKTKLPYVMYAHGSFDQYALRISKIRKMLFWITFDKYLYNKADAVVALTEVEKYQMASMGIRKPIHVIPNGVQSENNSKYITREDIDRKWPILKERPYILFLGRLHPKKGIDVLIKSFKKINRNHPNHVLVIAGPNEEDYGNEILKLIRHYDISRSVLLTGTVNGQLKEEILKMAEVFVLSSRSEGLPMAVLEAMAVGTPVIITQQCNVPEVEEYNAGRVIKLDINELTGELTSILNDASLRKQMGQNGRLLVSEKFTWGQVADSTIALCGNIINSKTKQTQG